MSGYYDERVIKPPMERIASGKIFKPARSFIFKGWIQAIVFFAIWWVIIIVGWIGLTFLIYVLSRETWTPIQHVQYVNTWWTFVSGWYWGIALIILGIIFTVWALYVVRIEYSILAETGQPMPEIYVKKGIMTVTEKHVPFRTITSVFSKKGIFDRLFGIGSVEIQTAGMTGSTSPGGFHTKPEEKLEGLPYFNELRDFILRELRRFTGQYVTGTEVVAPQQDNVFAGSGQGEILQTLQDMRDILRRMDEKLNRRDK
ncbi:MAG: PH domain-containing protein [Candidatus Thorarchaeota archaeon]|jgi:membrane protein YdbS with pleckstrin-like domain